jgi:hypothetical protein
VDKKESNYEHYFGNLQKAQDTLMLLKYDNHIRKECREFKSEFDKLSQWDVIKWLESDCINPKW